MRGRGGYLEHALIVRQVFWEQALIASSDAGRLGCLVSDDQLLQLERAIEVAPRVDDLLNRIEEILIDIKRERGDPRENAPDEYAGGDLMSREAAGWAIFRKTTDSSYRQVPVDLHCKGRKAQTAYGWHWNVTSLAVENPQLSDLISELKAVPG